MDAHGYINGSAYGPNLTEEERSRIVANYTVNLLKYIYATLTKGGKRPESHGQFDSGPAKSRSTANT